MDESEGLTKVLLPGLGFLLILAALASTFVPPPYSLAAMCWATMSAVVTVLFGHGVLNDP